MLLTIIQINISYTIPLPINMYILHNVSVCLNFKFIYDILLIHKIKVNEQSMSKRMGVDVSQGIRSQFREQFD